MLGRLNYWLCATVIRATSFHNWTQPINLCCWRIILWTELQLYLSHIIVTEEEVAPMKMKPFCFFFFFFTRIWLDWYRYKTLTSGNWKQDTVFSLSLHSWCPLRWTDFWRNLNSFKMQYHVAEPCPQFRLIFICVTLCRYEIWHHKFKWWSKDEMHQLPLKTVILWKTDRWIERQKKNRPHEVLEILPFLWMLYLRRCCIIINSFSRITFYDMVAWHLSKAFKITYIGRKKYWRDLSLFQELEHF